MITIDSLVIEVTRKCNMECGHCLRGPRENKDISPQYIQNLLVGNAVSYIGSLTFTGGEPSLNVPAIRETLNLLKNHEIGVGGFYIATNGKNISTEFVLVCLELYAYCDEKELCSVDVSNDAFHQQEGSYDTTLLGGLGFFKRKHEIEGIDLSKEGYLINQGYYADNFDNGRDLEPERLEVEKYRDIYNISEGTVYLNARGNILSGCDWSYKNQDNNDDEIFICKAEDDLLKACIDKYGVEAE